MFSTHMITWNPNKLHAELSMSHIKIEVNPTSIILALQLTTPKNTLSVVGELIFLHWGQDCKTVLRDKW